MLDNWLKFNESSRTGVSRKIELLKDITQEMSDDGLTIDISSDYIPYGIRSTKYSKTPSYYSKSQQGLRPIIKLEITDLSKIDIKNIAANRVYDPKLYDSEVIKDFEETLKDIGLQYRSKRGGDNFVEYYFDKFGDFSFGKHAMEYMDVSYPKSIKEAKVTGIKRANKKAINKLFKHIDLDLKAGGFTLKNVIKQIAKKLGYKGETFKAHRAGGWGITFEFKDRILKLTTDLSECKIVYKILKSEKEFKNIIKYHRLIKIDIDNKEVDDQYYAIEMERVRPLTDPEILMFHKVCWVFGYNDMDIPKTESGYKEKIKSTIKSLGKEYEHYLHDVINMKKEFESIGTHNRDIQAANVGIGESGRLVCFDPNSSDDKGEEDFKSLKVKSIRESKNSILVNKEIPENFKITQSDLQNIFQDIIDDFDFHVTAQTPLPNYLQSRHGIHTPIESRFIIGMTVKHCYALDLGYEGAIDHLYKAFKRLEDEGYINEIISRLGDYGLTVTDGRYGVYKDMISFIVTPIKD